MRDDTAFMDRIHAYLPGWDVPKMQPTLFTDHFGLVSDFLSECFSRLPKLQGRDPEPAKPRSRSLSALVMCPARDDVANAASGVLHVTAITGQDDHMQMVDASPCFPAIIVADGIGVRFAV